jgi:uncharacterized protein YndB with AHSA1/START domain
MTAAPFTRRDFAVRMASITARRADAQPAAGEILRNAEAIHQEVMFKASRARVYDALTNAKQFDKVVRASEAMQPSMPPGAPPTEISRQPGGGFSLFAGHITGRNVELVPNQLLVQAWRAGDWKPGVYSIVSFQLSDQGTGTKLVFDHTGFPQGQAQHLADGWRGNYWKPLEKVLA